MELSHRILTSTLLAGALTLATTSVRAENPYQSIVKRNAFGLNPPAPPAPPPVVEPPPPAPVATVKLTGITAIFGPPKAIFEIQEPAGKEIIKPPPLAAGTSMNGVEVISIDVDKFEVLIKTGGITTNIVFDAPALASKPPPPRGPAGARARPRTSTTRRSTPTASSRTSASYRSTRTPTPTAIGGGGNVSGSGRISVGGGQATAAAPSATARAPVPTRSIRQGGMSRQEALELLKMQRSVQPPPLPPVQR